MSNARTGETTDLFDWTTGQWLGVLDQQGREVMIPSYSTDTSGNVTGLVGPGGAAAQLSQAALRRPLRVIPVGTSITAGSSTSPAAGVWYFNGTTTELPVMLAGRRFSLVRNAGVAGNTSAQILARLQSDCLLYRPDIVLLEMLTNDLPAMQSNFATGCIAPLQNLQSAVQQCLLAGALPIIVTPPPSTTNNTAAMRVQWFCYDMAKYYGVPLMDTFRAMADPAQQGNYLAANTSDGTHPNNTGIALMSQLTSVLTDLSACPAYTCAVVQNVNTEQSNLIRNGNFASGNGVWTINSTNAVVTNPVAVFPYTGTSFNYAKSVAGAAYALSGATATLIEGNVYEFTGAVTVSGVAPSTSSGFTLSMETSGRQARPFSTTRQNGTFEFDYTFTPPVGNGGGWYPTLYVADAATWSVNNLTLVNVTALRAIYNCGWTTYPTT